MAAIDDERAANWKARGLFALADALSDIALAASAVKARVLVAAWRIEDGDPCRCFVRGTDYGYPESHSRWCPCRAGVDQ